MASEAELLARCRRGDADAWDELFDLHYAATGRFIFQLASDLTRVFSVCFARTFPVRTAAARSSKDASGEVEPRSMRSSLSMMVRLV